jgi:glycosyltransferase involved in cell wall biosynthesis
MRVLHVVGCYPPATEWGGLPAAVAGFTRALALAGVECDVFTTTGRGSRALPWIAPGTRDVDGTRVTYHRAPDVFRSFVAPGLVPALRRVREFDLVHVHMLWAFPGILAARAARWAGVPYVVSPHGALDPWSLSQWPRMKRAFLWCAEDQTLRRAAFVHYTADAERDVAPAEYRVLPAEIVANVVDPEPFAAIGRDGRRRASRDVLVLGRIHPMKGFDLLVPALREVRRRVPEARLVVAGPDEGGYRRVVERLAAEAGVSTATIFTGHLEAPARARALEDAAVLVMPSYRENFGLSAAEAMASGLPVIVSDKVNICSDVAAAGAGMVVSLDAAELAAALAELLLHPERRAAMGEAGRALVRDRYAPARVGAELRAAYERALGRDRAA